MYYNKIIITARVPDKHSSEYVPHAHCPIVTGGHEVLVVSRETRRPYAAATVLDESV